jgi:hypothetical protein
VKQVLIAILSLTTTLIVVMLVWIAPAVGTKDSACEQYPSPQAAADGGARVHPECVKPGDGTLRQAVLELLFLP